MKIDDAMKFLRTHMDERVVAAGLILAERLQKDKDLMDFVQTSIADVRMNIKYIEFDLEATRRERDEYKRKLDAKS